MIVMQQLFLTLLNDHLHNRTSQQQPIDAPALYQLANEHQVSCIIYQQIYHFPQLTGEIKNFWKRQTIQASAFQTMKTERFLRLYRQLNAQQLKVIVVKGLIVRELYPQPDLRTSNDEDLYVAQEDYAQVKALFLKEKLTIVEEGTDVTTFLDPASGLSIELHTQLFDQSSQAYGRFQHYFDQAFADAITVSVHQTPVFTLDPTRHLLFLLMHFIKHFLHGGVGIRQVMDISLFTEHYTAQINWREIWKIFQELHQDFFVAHVFALCQHYFELPETAYTSPFTPAELDIQPLLDDIVEAGIFGKSSMERLHSSTMTLNAMADEGKRNIFKSIFPSRKAMSGRYPYLKQYPMLLPIAWIDRIWHYLLDKNHGDHQKTIDIGTKRIDLLKYYRMIDKK